MGERPNLEKSLDSQLFKEYYYLKEELVTFCRENDLPTSGGKEEFTRRIAYFLETGKVLTPSRKSTRKKNQSSMIKIDKETRIESNFVCSEVHRAFFKEQIGSSFSFNVAFQKWLKANAGKTYEEAITTYGEILAEKKRTKATIDKQFEYNTYIRDFFEDNKGATLQEAIQCWKYKKQLQGHNRYEKADLVALEKLNSQS